MRPILLLLAAAVLLPAQIPTEAPLLIQLIRKPGARWEPVRPYPSAKPAIQVLGMTSITGMVETWHLELHDTFSSIEDLDRALAAVSRNDNPQDELAAPSRTIIAIRRLRSSHQPDEALKLLPRARYFQVSWSDAKAAADPSISIPNIAYQVLNGDLAGLYFYLSPLVSLRTIDENMARYLPGQPGFLSSATQGGVGHEHNLFRVEQRLSWVSDEFAAADPGFWKSQTK